MTSRLQDDAVRSAKQALTTTSSSVFAHAPTSILFLGLRGGCAVRGTSGTNEESRFDDVVAELLSKSLSNQRLSLICGTILAREDPLPTGKREQYRRGMQPEPR